MSEERGAGEQSMEDILASIRRIISDEGDEPAGEARSSPDEAARKAPGVAVANGEPVAAAEPASVGPTGRQPDDLSDILEPRRPTGAQVEPVSSFGERPKASVAPLIPSAESSANGGEEKSVASRLERPASLTERLALRERMASLDLKRRTAEAISKTDIEPVARREVGEARAEARSFPAIELGGPEPAKPSAEPAALTAKAPEPVVPVAPKAEAQAANEARTKPADEVTPSRAAEKPTPLERPSEAVVRPGAGNPMKQTPGPEALARDDKASDVVAKEPTGPVKSSVASDVKVTTDEVRVAPSEGGAGQPIPSSVAVGVGALNKVAGPSPAETPPRKDKHEPSPALVEAAREALHEDDETDEGPGAGALAATEGKTIGASATLEEVVHAALQPVLKSWLDENLPRIIEKQVREEVQRAMASAKRNRAG